jgi:hypothetical protein
VVRVLRLRKPNPEGDLNKQLEDKPLTPTRKEISLFFHGIRMHLRRGSLFLTTIGLALLLASFSLVVCAGKDGNGVKSSPGAVPAQAANEKDVQNDDDDASLEDAEMDHEALMAERNYFTSLDSDKGP